MRAAPDTAPRTGRLGSARGQSTAEASALPGRGTRPPLQTQGDEGTEAAGQYPRGTHPEDPAHPRAPRAFVRRAPGAPGLGRPGPGLRGRARGRAPREPPQRFPGTRTEPHMAVTADRSAAPADAAGLAGVVPHVFLKCRNTAPAPASPSTGIFPQATSSDIVQVSHRLCHDPPLKRGSQSQAPANHRLPGHVLGTVPGCPRQQTPRWPCTLILPGEMAED